MIRILAPHRDRQLAMIAAADAAADRADAAVTAGWGKLMGLLRAEHRRRKESRSLATSGFLLAVRAAAVQMYVALRDRLHTDLSGIAVQGYDSAVDTLVKTLPARVLQRAADGRDGPDRDRVGADANPRNAIVARAQSRPGAFTLRHSVEGVGRGGGEVAASGRFAARNPPGRFAGVALLEADAPTKSAVADLLFPPLSYDTVREILRRPIAGRDWQQDLSASTRLAGPDLIAHLLAGGLSRGQTPAEVARDLLPAVQGVQTTARRISRTYGMQVAHHAAQKAHSQLGDMVVGYEIHSAKFPSSRSWHVARSGQQYFKHPKQGQKGYAQLPHPPLEAEDASERPAGTPHTAWNCLLPGTMVQGRFVGGLKSHYTGKIVEIVTRSGHRLAVTPNHPIFTVDGFVPAKLIHQGSHLVCHRGDIVFPRGVGRHPEQEPAPIEDVFGAIAVLCTFPRTKTAGLMDLHGDAIPAKEIHVVAIDGPLRLDMNADLSEFGSQEVFAGPASSAAFVFGPGSLGQRFGRRGRRQGGKGLLKPLAPDSGIGDAQPGQAMDFGTSSQFAAALPETALDRGGCDAERCGDLNGRLAGLVADHNVVGELHVGEQSVCLGSSSEFNSSFAESVPECASVDTNIFRQSLDVLARHVPSDQGFHRDRGVSEERRFGPASELDARLSQPAGDSVSGDLEVLGELMQRFPESVLLDDVVDVQLHDYSGDVYDLQTTIGYYAANRTEGKSGGVLVANCLCFLTPILSDVDEPAVIEPVQVQEPAVVVAPSPKQAAAPEPEKPFWKLPPKELETTVRGWLANPRGTDELQDVKAGDFIQLSAKSVARLSDRLGIPATTGHQLWLGVQGALQRGKSGTPFKPPMKVQLEEYKPGDAKVKKILAVGDKLGKLSAAVEAAQKRTGELYTEYYGSGKPTREQEKEYFAKLAKTHEDWNAALAKRNAAREHQRADAHKHLAVDKPVHWTATKVNLSKEVHERVGKVEDFLAKVVHRKPTDDLRRPNGADGLHATLEHIPPTEEQRDHHVNTGKATSTVRLSADTSEKTVAHELGHSIEAHMPGALSASHEFLAHRCGDEPFQKLADVFPGRGYKPDETGRKDNFGRYFTDDHAYYCGKDYGRSTEIISMGVEALYHDPVGFVQKDPEYAKLILGILDGHLR